MGCMRGFGGVGGLREGDWDLEGVSQGVLLSCLTFNPGRIQFCFFWILKVAGDCLQHK